MLTSELVQCRHLLTIATPILRDLNDSHRALEPMPGAKTAGWLVGHLAVTGDFARQLCGRPPLCPQAWRAMFNPGSQPSDDAEVYPPMAALKELFSTVYEELCDCASAVPPAVLTAANPYSPARAIFPTAADFLAYLMTTHLAYHLGQLVGWRAAAGLGRAQRRDPSAV